MKTLAALAVSIVLVSMLFCPMVMAFPPMPNDVQVVQPDPSLPKELAALLGKWEGKGPYSTIFLIVEKIGGEKASLYEWHSGHSGGVPEGWQRIEAKVIKEYGKYKLWYQSTLGQLGSTNVECTLKGKDLSYGFGQISYRFTRVP